MNAINVGNRPSPPLFEPQAMPYRIWNRPKTPRQNGDAEDTRARRAGTERRKKVGQIVTGIRYAEIEE